MEDADKQALLDALRSAADAQNALVTGCERMQRQIDDLLARISTLEGQVSS